ncbi:MAG: hypothetical protein ACW981_02050 [Candidatus Hodarchaeales archaeon]|jgi:hypothetical protein
MARRILRPSERIKLQELGLTREEIDEYADSDFQDVEDWIAVKKFGATTEDYKLFKESGFKSFDEFKEAYEMGFELQDEYEQARGGNFPTRATWIFARELGIMTHKKYLDHLAEQKALDTLTPTSSSPNTEKVGPIPPVQSQSPPIQQPMQTFIEKSVTKEYSHPPEPDRLILEKPKPTSRPLPQQTESPAPDRLVLEKPKPTSRHLTDSAQPPPLSQPPLIKTEPMSSMPIQTDSIEDKPRTPSNDDIIAQAHQGSSIQDLLQKYPIPVIDPSEFMDNPTLEQMFRFAEVLEQTTQANLEDFTTALSFGDVAEIEEWLEQFDSELFLINFEENVIIFKPELYPIILERIKNLRNG